MSTITKNAEQYILELLNKNLKSEYLYHNFNHTKNVVSAIKEIAKGENLSKDDTEIVVLAGWFHDAGYTIDIKKHENHSIEIAKKFFAVQEYPSEKAEKVYDAILGTLHNQEPTNYFQQILSDADFYHLAKSNYTDIAAVLKVEMESTCNLHFSKKEWIEENIKLFRNHKYYTKYATVNWTNDKNKNLIALQKTLTKSIKKADEANKSERSIDTLFRVTLKNHITLSDIADTKANILLSVNAIIISMALSNLIPKFDNPANAFLIYPTIIFVAFSIVSMILSVIATRPSVTSGTFSKEDIKNKKVNILFFGNFHKMSLPEFEEGIQEVMNDKDYLYSSMSKDLFFLGLVLARKYRILRLTYTVFMIGIIVSVIAFAISYKLLCVVQ